MEKNQKKKVKKLQKRKKIPVKDKNKKNMIQKKIYSKIL